MAENSNSADKIKTLEEKLKMAYAGDKFSEAKMAASEISAIDPKNSVAQRFLEKITDKEAEVNRKAHALEINKLQDQVKEAFKKSQFDAMETACQTLLKLDSQNSVVLKFRAKVADAKKALEKAKMKAAQPKKPGLLERFDGWLKQRKAAKPALAKVISAKPAAPNLAPVVPASVPVKPAPVIATPVAVKTPVSASATMSGPSVMFQKPTMPQSAAPQKPIAPEGNLFTRMFGAKEAAPMPQTKSIIETIVAKTEKKPEQKTEKQKDLTGASFLRLANGFFQFSVAFIMVSAAFFYVENKDIENRVLGLLKRESYASQWHQASQTLEEKQEEVRLLTKDIERFEKGYNNRYEEVISQIVAKRLNWPDILQKINEITNTIYEHNELSQYIQYTSFTFDAAKGLIRVSGTLTDPLGKNLTKLVELEEAFRNYPRNPSDPNDKTEPYFYDFQEFNSLRKSLDRSTGKYTSSFQLSFALKPQTE